MHTIIHSITFLFIWKLDVFSKKSVRGFLWIFKVLHSPLLHLSPSDSTVSDDAGIKSRTVAIGIHKSAIDLIHRRLDLIHSWLDLTPNSVIDLIHTRLDLNHIQLDLIHYSGRSYPQLGYRPYSHSARSQPHLARSHPQLGYRYLHTWLDLIPNSAIDLIHTRLDLIHK